MPELPEVETTRRGIEPLLVGRDIIDAIFRVETLRRPLPERQELIGQRIVALGRRAKYLFISTDSGCLIVHLGMSGHLRVVPAARAPGPHDHADLVLNDGTCLRLNDPRRFGMLLWTREVPELHPFLVGLGPEPLSRDFDGGYLFERIRSRKASIKTLVMNQAVVVGVGNIYANEALFVAGIHPQTSAGTLSVQRCEGLAEAIRQVLEEAIAAGGTTLRDFSRPDGRPGYFAQQLRVYGRAGENCRRCGEKILRVPDMGRSSYLCPRCQTP